MEERLYGSRFHVRRMSVNELADGYTRPLTPANRQHTPECEPANHSRDWMGGIRNRLDAETVMRDGWSDGAAKALELKEELAPELPRAKSTRRRQRWGADGSHLDTDRAMAGQWEIAFRQTYREMQAGTATCVTLVAGWGGNCNLTSEELFWSGAAMLVLSDILENAGYSTRIDAVCKNESNRHSGYVSLNIVTVKDHGDPMLTDALAGVVCHAGIFRSFGFRAICTAPWDVGGGLGHSIDWEEVDHHARAAGYEGEPDTIRVRDCYTRDQALAEIRRVLAILQG